MEALSMRRIFVLLAVIVHWWLYGWEHWFVYVFLAVVFMWPVIIRLPDYKGSLLCEWLVQRKDIMSKTEQNFVLRILRRNDRLGRMVLSVSEMKTLRKIEDRLKGDYCPHLMEWDVCPDCRNTRMM